MTQLTWQFDENRTNERDGFHDTGVSHFTSNRLDSLVREAIQNSLDARDDPSRPVTVIFAGERVKGDQIDSRNLIRSILDSVDSRDNDDRDKAAFKETALSLLKGNRKNVRCLKIEDANTTGARDDGDDPTMWSALTKGSGLNVKPRSDAGGSFGIGKFAAFAASDVRTVLYSTAWTNSSGSDLHHRFIGKTILVSRTDRKSQKKLRGTGYLAAADFDPASDDGVPERLKMENPGTTIRVLRKLDDDWGKDVRTSVSRHFWHAIIHNGLSATIDKVKVTDSNIEGFLPDDEKLRRFVRVSRDEPIDTTKIQGIGTVNLRLEVHLDDRSNRSRDIALVRDAGMMITDERRDMGLSPIRALSTTWHGFTAVIECLSEGESSLLRDCESPQHNKISIDEISDEQKRREAERQLKRLGRWVRDTLKKHVAPEATEDPENASELAQYLPLTPEQDGGDDPRENRNGGYFAISGIQKKDQRPPSSPRRNANSGGGSSAQGGSGPSESGGRNGGRTRSGRRRRGTRRENNVAFGDIRFSRQSHPNELVVSFDNPRSKINGVKLEVVAEDDNLYPIKITRAEYATGERLGVDTATGGIKVIESDDNRIKIKMRTLEPIANKTFILTEIKK